MAFKGIGTGGIEVSETPWIEWSGGACPVSGQTTVKVWFEYEPSEAEADSYRARPAQFWSHAWHRGPRVFNRIKAYRVVSE